MSPFPFAVKYLPMLLNLCCFLILIGVLVNLYDVIHNHFIREAEIGMYIVSAF